MKVDLFMGPWCSLVSIGALGASDPGSKWLFLLKKEKDHRKKKNSGEKSKIFRIYY